MIAFRDINAALYPADCIVEGLDVVGRRATTPTNHIDESVSGELPEVDSEVFRCLVITSHRIGQAGIRVGVHIALSDFGQALKEGVHLLCPECAIEPNAERLCIHHRDVKSLSILS